MPNRIVHFEIEAKDMERAKNFYSSAFGWKMEQMGKDYGDYIVITTGDPKEPGGINGGLYKTSDTKKEVNAYRCVIEVNDVEEAMAKVKASGGKVLGKPDDIPNIGLYVSCEDTEGNKFTLLQPSSDMTPEK